MSQKKNKIFPGWYIVIATIPALLAGYLLKDAVEALFRMPLLQASIRLFAAAIARISSSCPGGRRNVRSAPSDSDQ